MVAVAPLDTAPEPREQRMLLHHVAWRDYLILRELLDGPGLRMTYVKGALELMSPSPEHELWKKSIARLIELFAHRRGVDLHAYGSTTFKKEAVERGAEPDECYLLGKKLTGYPEIVLEVVHTVPLLDKLDVYRVFGVAEVWVFREGRFTIHVLDRATGRYALKAASSLIPDLDFETVARYAMREDTPQALREFEREIAPA